MIATTERLATALAARYRIERELGQGGMATVYLAQDLRHDRKVALKVLKPELAAVLGADRFVVEIKTTASLQHPHILPLFDSGSADGFLYYVMPFIEGETLRRKLDRETQLAIDEAVRITTQVADALDYAHRHGVIHRDIKPENILLHDGRPMVADFGIALAVSAAAGGRMTETGLSLGTPHYMSPEQATADKEITARSDVYSLASVLYEMLTGNPPHTGASAQQIIMKIVTEEAAPVTRLRKSVPPNVADAVAKALERLPADRFESARAFSTALVDPAFRATAPSAVGAAGAPDRRWRQRAAVPALLAVGLLLAALGWALGRPPAPQPVTRYQVQLAEGQKLDPVPWSRLAVSPDGSQLVYVGVSGRGAQLYLRSRDRLDAVALPGTETAINPVFSPDGGRVAFIAGVGGHEIRAVSLAGGPAVVITDSAVGTPGIAWGPDGFIYYDVVGIGPLMRVRDAGDMAEAVGHLDSAKGELQHSWPDVLPNGRGVIMTVSRGGPGAMGGELDEIAVLDLASGTHRSLVRGVYGRYARSGHLVYVTTNGTLMAVGFDQKRMQLTGEPVALAEGVAVRSGGGAVDLTLSASGTLWYTTGGVAAGVRRELVWVERDGSAKLVTPGWSGLFYGPALSPDGTRLAIAVNVDAEVQVWIKALDQGTLSKLTFEGTNNRPVWTPDGRSVAFVSERGPSKDLYQRLADASRPATLLLNERRPVEEVSFSSDGSWMVYRVGASPQGDLHARRTGTDTSIVLVATSADESSPALSPDGRWLAYVSNESGNHEVYVRPFPNTADGRWQISERGGREPVWAHSGRELFYRTWRSPIESQMVMDIVPGSTFIPGARRILFPLTGYWLSLTHPEYAVSPNDRRFVMIRNVAYDQEDRLVVVENFFEELRARVGRR